ncbi:hypothetical protein [Bacillus sp. FSL K6-3431]|uniref:hypothetical protein n=1 Tax=Bacillus sp. FSL K6-3431 TaxID=2921500 RepID=UPI0030F66D91
MKERSLTCVQQSGHIVEHIMLKLNQEKVKQGRRKYMGHELSKKGVIIGNIVTIVVGLCLFGITIFFNFIPYITSPSIAILGMFLIVGGIIGLLIDIRTTDKQKKPPPWLPNLLSVLGIFLIISGTFYVFLNSSHNLPSVPYVIASTSMGSVLLIFSFGNDIWRKYNWI